uniref:Ig-like domain-containing protein n=1 Tax=Myripristis murdjan TaxID=586833 RepID=A0A667Y9T8_9TELE
MEIFTSFVSSVLQTPAALQRTVGGNANFSCSHKVSEVFYLYWYRQRQHGEPLICIGYLYSTNINIESSFQHRFTLRGDSTKHSYLEIHDLSREDRGEYFCAIRQHNDINSLSADTKPPTLKLCTFSFNKLNPVTQ